MVYGIVYVVCGGWCVYHYNFTLYKDILTIYLPKSTRGQITVTGRSSDEGLMPARHSVTQRVCELPTLSRRLKRVISFHSDRAIDRSDAPKHLLPDGPATRLLLRDVAGNGVKAPKNSLVPACPSEFRPSYGSRCHGDIQRA